MGVFVTVQECNAGGIGYFGTSWMSQKTLRFPSSDNVIKYFVPLSYFVRNIGNLGRPRFFQATYPSLVNIHHSHMLQKK